jgi:nitrite reductase (NO-forming)
MKKESLVLGGFACLSLVFVGAGCSSSTNINVDSGAEDVVTDTMPPENIQAEETSAVGTETTVTLEGDMVDSVTGVVTGGVTVTTEEPKKQPAEVGPAKKVSVVVLGKNFGFSETEIRVKKGDTVEIQFTNEAGFHDWVLDEFNAKTKQLKAGESETVTFVADKAGTFEYYCSVGSHRQMGMVGTLIVE